MYAILFVAVAALAFSLYSMVSQNYFGDRYKDALKSQNPDDICAAPSGYTDAQWKEHMGHHPDQYAQCLS